MGLRQTHLAEVCTLSGWGKSRTPMRSITDRHSLSPRSHTRFPNSLPCSSPAVLRCRSQGRESGLPRSTDCRPRIKDVWSVYLGPVYPGAAQQRRARIRNACNLAARHFGYGLTAGLAIHGSPGFNRQFTYVALAEQAWPLIRLPAGRVRTRPSRAWHAAHGGGTLSGGLHTAPLPALHATVGCCWSYNRSRPLLSSCVTRQSATSCRTAKHHVP